MQIQIKINGELKTFEIEAGETLLNLLRRSGYYGVKQGCGEGYCGSCTVLLEGKPVNSCKLFAAKAHNREVLTIEGLGNALKLHPLQQAFITEGAIQCGYCSPGFLLSAYALLKDKPNPSVDEVKLALDGNLCRCTGYVKPVKAVLRAAQEMAGGR
jgi:aerobic-type carbon monoxide dehydrogenase small subunit (CoxS/CutS family)